MHESHLMNKTVDSHILENHKIQNCNEQVIFYKDEKIFKKVIVDHIKGN